MESNQILKLILILFTTISGIFISIKYKIPSTNIIIFILFVIAIIYYMTNTQRNNYEQFNDVPDHPIPVA